MEGSPLRIRILLITNQDTVASKQGIVDTLQFLSKSHEFHKIFHMRPWKLTVWTPKMKVWNLVQNDFPFQTVDFRVNQPVHFPVLSTLKKLAFQVV